MGHRVRPHTGGHRERPGRRDGPGPLYRLGRRRAFPPLLHLCARWQDRHLRRDYGRGDLRRAGQQLDHHQRRRRAHGRQAHRDAPDAPRPGSREQFPQHPGRRHPRRVRRVERAGGTFPDAARAARDRTALLHPGSRWIPDRGGSDDAPQRLASALVIVRVATSAGAAWRCRRWATELLPRAMGISRNRERVFTRNSQVRPGSGTALEPIVVSSATARVARDHGGTMNDSTTPRGRTGRWAGAAGLLAAGAITGGVLAATLSANAATTSTPSSSDSSSSSSSTTTTEQPRATYPAHRRAEQGAREKPVTGSAASQAQAAAVEAVGSGTAGDVTTDVSGNGYEVTVTKSDGSTVEVHLDSSLNPDAPGRPSG